jgi:predicted NUDIX family NTP pyrophosphohydrolase
MASKSAGILSYKYDNSELRVLLAHPGGPFWAQKDNGAWSIPKGLFEENEEPINAAKREFKEETGFDVEGELIELGALKQPSRKIIYAWAVEQDIDVSKIVSNKFALEWPNHSGNIKEFPEIDRCQWFGVAEAKIKIIQGQAAFIDTLIKRLQYSPFHTGITEA